jgi:ferredoxin
LSLAHEHDVDLEGMSLFYTTYLDCCFGGLELILGACERSIACSTCHVILDPEVYDKLPEPEDEENDMLDLAFALEDTYVYFPLLPSRLTLSCDLPINRICGFIWDSSPMSPMCLDGADIRSRLGCQVFLTKEVDGMVAKLPSATRNMYVDGESFPLSFIPLRGAFHLHSA